MLINTKLIDGQQGKELDKLCTLYTDISLQVNDLNKTKQKTSNEIKEICNEEGAFESMNFVVNISKTKGSHKLDADLVKGHLLANGYEELWEELCTKCMTYSEGYLKLGTIKSKTNI